MPKCNECRSLYEPHEAHAHRFCVLSFGGAYSKILDTWPPALKTSFESYNKKFWVSGRQHYQYIDNYRVARVGDVAEMGIYAIAKEAGCCGSFDKIIELDGVKITFGFNHGH